MDVGIANVTLVWAWMHGDALSAEALGVEREAHHIRVIAAPRVAKRRDLVDVHR